MQQLTMQDLKELIQDLEKMNIDLSKMQVYLGNDEELNGVHNAWNITLLDKNYKGNDKDIKEDMDYIIDMINQDYSNIELKDKGILIS